jgi:uncharacterized DUF497 family protein
MRFDWDEQKNRENRRRHRVSFEIATEVFSDPFCLTIEDQTVDGEERLWTLGSLENLTILVVVHSTRNEEDEEVIRIISARKATPRERAFYEEPDT